MEEGTLKIEIDNKEHLVGDGKNLLEVCLSLGYDLPYFCWHPAMGSVGACRQCAVKKYRNEDDKSGKIIMACMEPVSDELRISIKDPEASKFRKYIVELLMANHPHDCPVCDEGGECHLQDMTAMNGHNYRRFRFKKRTYNNQFLGPFIDHEMNRCIHCYRCTRFYRNYADGKDLDVFASHNHIYFGRYDDGVLESEFSGNLVEICPTGVFTDKTLKNHYTRKWDLTSAPSICPHCSLGCNTIVGERYGLIRRVLSRYNSEINGYFLCDRGRFGYEFNNHKDRIKNSIFKREDGNEIFNIPQALNKASELISSAKTLVGIGSPRASTEANYMLKKLVGADNFYAGISNQQLEIIKRIQSILSNNPVKTASLKEISNCDAVLILGEDLTNTAPMMALAIRQAVRQKPRVKAEAFKIPLWQDAAVRELIQEEKGPLYLATSFATKLEDISTKSYHAIPKNLACLGFHVAHLLDQDSENATVPNKVVELAEEIANALSKAKRPLIITGASSMEPLLIQAANNLAQALYKVNPDTKLSFVLPEANSMGLVMLESKSLFELAKVENQIDTLIIVENDLFIRNDKQIISNVFHKSNQIIVLDYLQNETTKNADLCLSSSTPAEAEGTFINQEGRAQRFYKVYQPRDAIMESWRWLAELSIDSMVENTKLDFESILTDLENSHPQFKGIMNLTPLADYRINGQKIAREGHRFSGRTSIHANENVSETKPDEENESPLSFTMEGYHGFPPPSLIPFYWSPGWNSVQAINKYQREVGGQLNGGNPWSRLLNPEKEARITYFSEFHKNLFSAGKDKMLFLPIHHIFGSEELSRKSPGINELSPDPYVGVSIQDADDLQFKEGDQVILSCNDSTLIVKVKFIDKLPKGLLAIPFEINGIFVSGNESTISLEKIGQ